MDIKVSSLIAVTVFLHASFWTPCDTFPLWSYIFNSDEKTEGDVENTTMTEIETKSEKVQPPEIAQKSSTTVTDIKTNSIPEPVSKESSGEGMVKPFMRNMGIARAPIGLLAGFMRLGTNGLRSVVKTSTDIGSGTIDQAVQLHDNVIDGTQDVIGKGAQKSIENIVPLMSQLDTYRRSFSGGTKTNADKAHKFTITTSSDAPINSLYGFAKDFMPAGAGTSSALPPITSIDMSEFFR